MTKKEYGNFIENITKYRNNLCVKCNKELGFSIKSDVGEMHLDCFAKYKKENDINFDEKKFLEEVIKVISDEIVNKHHK